MSNLLPHSGGKVRVLETGCCPVKIYLGNSKFSNVNSCSIKDSAYCSLCRHLK